MLFDKIMKRYNKLTKEEENKRKYDKAPLDYKDGGIEIITKENGKEKIIKE